MIDHDSAKTVRVIVTVKNRSVIFPTYLDLNAIRQDEFHAEMILTELDFVDKEVFDSLIKETNETFLPKHSRLLINISLKEKVSDEELRKFIITEEKPRPFVQGGFIEVYLEEDLQIKLRGSKKAQLLDCAVFIPAIKETAKSINHAYTLVSETFEKWRRSHTANVFHKVYWFDQSCRQWFDLDQRREFIESK
jgi:hypothetical protein